MITESLTAFAGLTKLTIDSDSNGHRIVFPANGISLGSFPDGAIQCLIPDSISKKLALGFLSFGTNALVLDNAYLSTAQVDTLPTSGSMGGINNLCLVLAWEHSWDLIPDLLEVQAPQVEVMIADATDGLERSAIYVSGSMTLADIPLQLMVVIPDMIVSASLPLKSDANQNPIAQSYPLAPLIEKFGISSPLLDNLTLNEFRIAGSALSHALSMDMGIGDSRNIQLPGGIDFTLKNVGLSISHIGGTPSYNRFAISGELAVGSATFGVSVGHGTGESVTVNGAADFAQSPVAPADIFGGLVSTMGFHSAITLPDVLAGFKVSAFSFSYASGSVAFSFEAGQWSPIEKFILSSVRFSANFSGAVLQALQLSAVVEIAGTQLFADGEYVADGGWQISAAMLPGDFVDVGALVGALIDGATGADAFPAFLKGVSVRNLRLTLAPHADTWSVSGDMTIKSSTGDGSIEAGLTIDHASGANAWTVSVSVDGAAQNVIDDVCGLLREFGVPALDLKSAPLGLDIISIGISHDGQAWTAHCSGAIVLEADGTSVKVDIQFKSSANAKDFNLVLAGLLFEAQTVAAGPTILKFIGPETVHLSDIGKLLRVAPLEHPDFDPSLTIESAFFASQATAGGQPTNRLLGLKLKLDSTLNTPILAFVTGGSGVGAKDVLLLAASTPWSTGDIDMISGALSEFAFPPQVPQGPSVALTIDVGGNAVFAPFMPSGQGVSTANGPGAGASSQANAVAPAPVTSPSATRWFNVQKQLGPVYLDRAGVALNGGNLDLLCDASMTLGPMTVGLEGFSFAFPFRLGGAPSGIDVSLRGMSLTYNKPPLTISGGFIHTTDAKGDDIYAGTASVHTGSLTLSAMGEYAHDADGSTSLALYAVLNEPPLGGPVFCFVTGLAGGFGYNSALKMPQRVEDVPNFVLLELAMPGGSGVDPLQAITTCITPSPGEDWLAVGILFRSFELVQSAALLTVCFGHEFRFAILGQSEMSLPPASAERVAYAQVDVEATYSPQAGALEVYGLLTPNSYVLSPDCHLSGGFAYILKDTGDFLLSFGGYAPDYDYASKGYPAVSRLQLSWQVDSHTSIKGDEYFAMTPAVMMAGGALQATWNSGIFSAWFDVAVDLFMQWRPFQYAGSFSMSLGVSFDLHIAFINVHFTFHVGASLAAKGPPFHGTAHIDLDVISFDVKFGPAAPAVPPLKWSEFRDLLPKGGVLSTDGSGAYIESDSTLLGAKVVSGLTKDLSQQAHSELDWVVNGTNFEFVVTSSVPITALDGAPNSLPATLVPAGAQMGVLPMGIESATGTFSVTIADINGTVCKTDGPFPSIVAELLTVDAPAAHWGCSEPASPNTPALPLPGRCRITASRPQPDRTASIPVSALQHVEHVAAMSSRAASSQPFG